MTIKRIIAGLVFVAIAFHLSHSTLAIGEGDNIADLLAKIDETEKAFQKASRGFKSASNGA